MEDDWVAPSFEKDDSEKAKLSGIPFYFVWFDVCEFAVRRLLLC